MRTNVNEDPSLIRKYHVFLDDMDVSDDAFESDDEEGYVRVYVKDRHGYPIKTKFPSFRWKTLRGTVRIERRGESEESDGGRGWCCWRAIWPWHKHKEGDPDA